jgi:hypothetical protein
VTPEQKAAAQEAKNAGNAAFSANQYADAVKHFTAAIAADPTDHIFFSNRRRATAGRARARSRGGARTATAPRLAPPPRAAGGRLTRSPLFRHAAPATRR